MALEDGEAQTAQRIAQLPELGPATLGLRVAARREPGTDPVGSLSFQLANAARASKYRGCASRLS